jgi:hypothetical protein
LGGRFARVTWTGNLVSVREPASEAAIAELRGSLGDNVSVPLDGKVSKPQLLSKTEDNKVLSDIITYHCDLSSYAFQFKKVEGCSCAACTSGLIKPIRMPLADFQLTHFLPLPVLDETGTKYKPFEEVWGTAPTETDLPVFGPTHKEKVPCGKSAANVRGFITCVDCLKPRVLWAAKALTPAHVAALQLVRERFDYRCGGPLLPNAPVSSAPGDGGAPEPAGPSGSAGAGAAGASGDTEHAPPSTGAALDSDPPSVHQLLQNVHVLRQINCGSFVEHQYYSARAKHVDVCVICGQQDDLQTAPADIANQYGSVHPLCQACVSGGAKFTMKGVAHRKRHSKEQGRKKRAAADHTVGGSGGSGDESTDDGWASSDEAAPKRTKRQHGARGGGRGGRAPPRRRTAGRS